MQKKPQANSYEEKNQFFLDLSSAIHEAETENMSMQQMLSILKTADEWQMILLWKWNSSENFLQCIEIVSESNASLEKFKKISKELRTSYSALSIPFHAIKEKKRIIVHSLKSDPRSEIAQEAGMGSGFVIPLFTHSQSSYVLEVYKKGPLNADNESQLHVMIDWIQFNYEIFFNNLLIKNKLETQKTVLDSTVDAVYSCDMEGNIQTWSKGCELIYKWTEEEIIGKSIKTFIPKNEEDHFNFLLQNFSQGKPIIHIETNAVNKNGEIFVIHTTYSIIRNDKNEYTGVAISAHDATCQYREREAILKSEEKYKTVVETIQEWICELDDRLRITYSNPWISKILGFSIEEILGKEIVSLLVEQEEVCYFKDQKSWENQVIQIRRKDNQVCYLECSAVPFRMNLYNDKMGFRLVARDIGARVLLEKMKKEFISVISHELRTPLSAIIAALDLLKKNELSKENRQEILEIITKNSHLLKELIDNILIIEKLQANQLPISKERISLKHLVAHSIECAKTLAEKKQINLCNELSEDIDVESDFTQLSQVLNNFLSNAIKFSSENSKIRIHANIDGARVRLSVSDEGKGISEEFKNKIFQKFAQEESAEKHTQPGTGLGLYISKEMIEKLGGKIGFVSEKTKGSTFYFELPVLS